MASKKFRTTYILIALLAVLFLFVYFFEKDKVVEDENEIETFQVVQVDQGDIKQIEFEYNDKATVVKKDGEKWKIIEPIKYQARTQKIDEVFTEMNEMESEQKFIADKLSDYGLDKPDTKIILTKDNDEKIEIMIGSLNPQQTKVYLKTSLGDEVYLVESSIESRLQLNDEVLKQD